MNMSNRMASYSLEKSNEDNENIPNNNKGSLSSGNGEMTISGQYGYKNNNQTKKKHKQIKNNRQRLFDGNNEKFSPNDGGNLNGKEGKQSTETIQSNDSTKRVNDIKQKFLKTKEKIMHALGMTKESDTNKLSTRTTYLFNNFSPVQSYSKQLTVNEDNDYSSSNDSINDKTRHLNKSIANLDDETLISYQHRACPNSLAFQNPVVVASATAPPLVDELTCSSITQSTKNQSVQQYPANRQLSSSSSSSTVTTLKKTKKRKPKETTKIKNKGKLIKSDSVRQKQSKANSLSFGSANNQDYNTNNRAKINQGKSFANNDHYFYKGEVYNQNQEATEFTASSQKNAYNTNANIISSSSSAMDKIDHIQEFSDQHQLSVAANTLKIQKSADESRVQNRLNTGFDSEQHHNYHSQKRNASFETKQALDIQLPYDNSHDTNHVFPLSSSSSSAAASYFRQHRSDKINLEDVGFSGGSNIGDGNLRNENTLSANIDIKSTQSDDCHFSMQNGLLNMSTSFSATIPDSSEGKSYNSNTESNTPSLSSSVHLYPTCNKVDDAEDDENDNNNCQISLSTIHKPQNYSKVGNPLHIDRNHVIDKQQYFDNNVIPAVLSRTDRSAWETNQSILSKELLEKALSDDEKDQIKYLINQINLKNDNRERQFADNTTDVVKSSVNVTNLLNNSGEKKQYLLSVNYGGTNFNNESDHVHILHPNRAKNDSLAILQENLIKMNCEMIDMNFLQNLAEQSSLASTIHDKRSSCITKYDKKCIETTDGNCNAIDFANYSQDSTDIMATSDYETIKPGTRCLQAIALAVIVAAKYNPDALIYLQHRLKINSSLSINRRTNIDDLCQQVLRRLQKLCAREWRRNKYRYATYMHNIDFEKEIQAFTENGHCCPQLENAVPLSIANSVGVKIQIITSMKECPLLQIVPDNRIATVTAAAAKNSVITLILTLDQNANVPERYGIAILKQSEETSNTVRNKNNKSVTFSDTPEIRTFERSDAEKAELLEWTLERNRTRRDKNSMPSMQPENIQLLPNHHMIYQDNGIPFELMDKLNKMNMFYDNSTDMGGGVSNGGVVSTIPIKNYQSAMMHNNMLIQQQSLLSQLPSTSYHMAKLTIDPQHHHYHHSNSFYPMSSLTPSQQQIALLPSGSSQQLPMYQHSGNRVKQQSPPTNKIFQSQQQQHQQINSRQSVPMFPIGGYIPSSMNSLNFPLLTDTNSSTKTTHSKSFTNPQLIQRTCN